VVATVERRGHVMWTAETAIAGADDLASAIAALCHDAPRGAGWLDVEVDSSLVQRRALRSLPAVSESRLRALVALQSSRFFRRNGHPLVTDARWQPDHRALRLPWRRAAARTVADAAALDESWALAVVEGARAVGLEVRRISPAEGSFQLLPASELDRRRRADGRRLRHLAAIAVTLWLLVGALYVIRLVATDRRDRAEIARLARPVAAVASARRELGRAAATLDGMRAAERRRSAVATELATIAAALPDSAYLTSLAVADDGRSGTLSGIALAASSVPPRIAGALSADARLASPALPDTTGGHIRERFTIVFARHAAP
jgi:Tfp pilus assembly protein PilN